MKIKALFILLILIAGFASGCKDEDKPAADGSLPVMTFEETEFDFGSIDQGEIATHVFKFKNTGGSELVISNAAGSCGCTVPEYPTAPIAAGAEEAITVRFNSAGKSGHQTKTVTITTNTASRRETLTIKASITPAG